jgi:ATP-dependent protease ClpP protease subunit
MAIQQGQPNPFADRLRMQRQEQMRLANWHRDNADQVRMQSERDGDVLTLTMVDQIGEYLDWVTWELRGLTAHWLMEELEEAGAVSTIRILLSSPGGWYDEGVAIANLLKRHEARVEIEVLGEAASAASLLLCVADHVAIHEGARVMIHEAWGCACGPARELRNYADGLESASQSAIEMYVSKTGKQQQEVQDAVEKTTWFTSHRAVEWGLADEVLRATDRGTQPQARRPAAGAQQRPQASARLDGNGNGQEPAQPEPAAAAPARRGRPSPAAQRARRLRTDPQFASLGGPTTKRKHNHV